MAALYNRSVMCQGWGRGSRRSRDNKRGMFLHINPAEGIAREVRLGQTIASRQSIAHRFVDSETEVAHSTEVPCYERARSETSRQPQERTTSNPTITVTVGKSIIIVTAKPRNQLNEKSSLDCTM